MTASAETGEATRRGAGCNLRSSLCRVRGFSRGWTWVSELRRSVKCTTRTSWAIVHRAARFLVDWPRSPLTAAIFCAGTSRACADWFGQHHDSAHALLASSFRLCHHSVASVRSASLDGVYYGAPRACCCCGALTRCRLRSRRKYQGLADCVGASDRPDWPRRSSSAGGASTGDGDIVCLAGCACACPP